MRFFYQKNIAYICLSREKRLPSVYHSKYIVTIGYIYILVLKNGIVHGTKGSSISW
jgi:hypothetical protein